MACLEIGSKFHDWNAFENAVQQYSAENYVIFVKHNTKSVEAANKLRTNKLD